MASSDDEGARRSWVDLSLDALDLAEKLLAQLRKDGQLAGREGKVELTYRSKPGNGALYVVYVTPSPRLTRRGA